MTELLLTCIVAIAVLGPWAGYLVGRERGFNAGYRAGKEDAS